MSVFDINPDIRFVETLSSSFYANEKYYEENSN